MEDPFRLSKPREEAPNIVLPQELLTYVTPAKLRENARRYPEMQWEPTEEQQERLRVIRDVLKKFLSFMVPVTNIWLPDLKIYCQQKNFPQTTEAIP